LKNKILKVVPGSIAEEMEIEVGDSLLSINGTEVEDIIDYKFLLADEFIEVEVEKANGEIWELEIEKEYHEDLGVDFENAILDNAKSCCNKCMFCFIDQLPKGMRKTLYFKDDDSRLSFLQGNFVTLTNLKDEDIDRIIRYRISPINVSVHTTDPELRVKMLNNRFAGNIYDRLKKLADAGITLNCQVVLVPGVNNKEQLIKTVEDLYKLYPAVQNVAAVPVGITKYREGLAELTPYDKASAGEEIDGMKALQDKYVKEIGEPFIRLSDEFYVVAERDIPASEFYGSFDQLEDGVGMIRIFRNNLEDTLESLKKDIKGSFTLVTGSSAYKEIEKAANIIREKNSNIDINCVKIINNFFGETITVAGLITGTDIIEQLSSTKTGDNIIIPINMLRSGENVFLDDISTEDIEKRLNKKVIICDYTGDNLIHLINDNSKEVKGLNDL